MVLLWKAVVVLALVLTGAGSAWQIQDWRYGKLLADRASFLRTVVLPVLMLLQTLQPLQRFQSVATSSESTLPTRTQGHRPMRRMFWRQSRSTDLAYSRSRWGCRSVSPLSSSSS